MSACTRSEAQIRSPVAQVGSCTRALPASVQGPCGAGAVARGTERPVEVSPTRARRARRPGRVGTVARRAGRGGAGLGGGERAAGPASRASRDPAELPAAPSPLCRSCDRCGQHLAAVTRHDGQERRPRPRRRARRTVGPPATAPAAARPRRHAPVLVLEVVGGLLTGSLALLADAGHMATDAAAVVLALGASYVATLRGGPALDVRPAPRGDPRRAAQRRGAARRLRLPGLGRRRAAGSTRAGRRGADDRLRRGRAGRQRGLAAGAHRSDTGSLNLRGAATEVLADLVGSVLTVAAGVVILATGWLRADPLATLLIAVLILPRSISLLRERPWCCSRSPRRASTSTTCAATSARSPGVTDVHDLHAWTITSGMASLSAHVTVTDACLAERGVGATLDGLSACVAEHFDVQHATFQVEPVSHREHEDLGEVH